MEPNPMAMGGVVDAEPGASAPGINRPINAEDNSKGRPGRKSREEEVQAYLSERGLMAVPGNDAGSGDKTGPGLADGGAFDPHRTQAGLRMLVDAADSVAIWSFEAKAGPIVGPDKVKEFGRQAAMAPVCKDTIVTSGVEICKAHDLNIGPELPLIGALMQWGWQLNQLRADLNRLAQIKAEQQPKNQQENHAL